MSVADYRAAVLADAPSDWWHLDDAAGATVANTATPARPLNASGGLTFQTDGPLGRAAGSLALAFDGTTGQLGGTAFNQYIPNTLTFECWMRANNANSLGVIVHARTNGYGLNVNPGGILECFSYLSNTNAPHTLSKGSILDGNWHHVVFYWSGSVLALYVDGQPQTSLSQVGPLLISYGANEQFFIGTDEGTIRFYAGLLAEVAIYRNITLSDARILAHAEALGYPLAPPGPPITGGNIISSLQPIIDLLTLIYNAVHKTYENSP